jgi:hypothetical protein
MTILSPESLELAQTLTGHFRAELKAAMDGAEITMERIEEKFDRWKDVNTRTLNILAARDIEDYKERLKRQRVLDLWLGSLTTIITLRTIWDVATLLIWIGANWK